MDKPEKQSVTTEVTQGIAGIAGLDISADRAAELAPQIQSLRESINAMDEVDLTDVEPATIFPLKQL